jgi:hypothetical protein
LIGEKNSIDPRRNEFDMQALEITLSSALETRPTLPKKTIFAVFRVLGGLLRPPLRRLGAATRQDASKGHEP